MKRKLSLLMVLMMMFTLVPMSAFAASEMTTSTVIASADAEVSFEAVVKPNSNFGITTTNSAFELMLGDNAEWKDLSVAATNATISNTYAGTKRLELKPTANDNIRITGTVKFSGAAQGDQKVTIQDVMNSNVSRQVVTYAIVSGSGNIISRALDSKTTLTRGTVLSTAQFEIREVDKMAMKDGKFTMRLPKDVTWNSADVKMNGAVLGTSIDGRDMIVTVTGTTNSIDRIVVAPKINITKDAAKGDIDVSFVNTTTTNINPDAVTVAEYKDYGVTVKVEKEKEIIAGKEETNKDYTVKVTLEPAGKSFNTNRPIDFKLTNGKVKLKSSSGINGLTLPSDGYKKSFEGMAANADGKITLELYVKAGWDVTAPVELTVVGGGVDEQKVKLANVIAPAKISAKMGDKKVSDVIIGLQNQVAPEILIEETKAGSLSEGFYVLDFAAARYNGIEFIGKDMKFKTTGNINVDDVYTVNRGSEILINVKSQSTKEPSTISITGVKVTLDRTVPFGEADLRFAAALTSDGPIALKEGKIDWKDGITTIVEKTPYLNVVTEVQDARKQKTVFTIGQATYMLGTESKPLDAAPFVSEGRTMLPIGTVAQIVGATVNYDPITRTATFDNGTRVVSMNLDSKNLVVNGSPVPMDAKPTIVNSRAFVPVVHVAQAFGIQNGVDIIWDAAAKTITIFPNAK